MTASITIQKKVAELCGFKNGDKNPEYETSLDAIDQAFDDFQLAYTLQKGINKESGDVGYVASHPLVSDAFSYTASKALCYLFIHLMNY